jgi:hypothetical protein
VQDPQVLLRTPRRLLFGEHVVGQAETARREQVRPEAVVRERPGLAHQPVDHVPVADLVPATPVQTRQGLHQLLGIPHLDPLRVQSGLHPRPDQPARYRVGVPLDVDRAPLVHPCQKPLARLQPPLRQRTKHGQFLGQAGLPVAVELPEELTQERFVRRPAAEVPAPTQQQRLLQRPLEAMMALLHVAILVRLGRLDRLPLQPVVTQQRLIALREGLRPLRPRRERRRQSVGAVHLRHAAQLPQGVLQPLAETLEALGEADRPRLPVGVGQHEVVDQVREHHPVDGHAQIRAVREVAGAQPAGVMHLGEEDLLGGPLQRTPTLHSTLERAQLPVGETPRVAALQVGEQRLGLQAGVELKHLLEFGPDRGEGIGPRAVVAFHASHLTG